MKKFNVEKFWFIIMLTALIILVVNVIAISTTPYSSRGGGGDNAYSGIVPIFSVIPISILALITFSFYRKMKTKSKDLTSTQKNPDQNIKIN